MTISALAALIGSDADDEDDAKRQAMSESEYWADRDAEDEEQFQAECAAEDSDDE